jgi:hypothetical protein
MSADEYSYSFLLLPKMKTATSTEHRTESSCAFLNKPPLRFRNVTERLRSSLMALISILRRPILTRTAGREVDPRRENVEDGQRYSKALERFCAATRRAGMFDRCAMVRRCVCDSCVPLCAGYRWPCGLDQPEY